MVYMGVYSVQGVCMVYMGYVWCVRGVNGMYWVCMVYVVCVWCIRGMVYKEYE